MRTATFVLSYSCLFLAAMSISRNGETHSGNYARADQVQQESHKPLVEAYGKLPLSFEENRGQTDPQVQFLSRGPGYTLFLVSTKATLAMRRELVRTSSGRQPSIATVSMKLVGANSNAKVSGLELLPGKSNYFIGNDPANWRTNISTYARVKYSDIYPGIDLIYYGSQHKLEFDFVVAPGANPRAIKLAISGAEKLRIDAKGDLVLGDEGNELRLHRPVFYQEFRGARQRIGGDFVIQGENEVRFEVARHDETRPLVIDPVLTYSTYLGGSGGFMGDEGSGIAVDSAGNAYVTGWTSSADFPTVNPFQSRLSGTFGSDNAFVAKLKADGSGLVYSTYIGGTIRNRGYGIAVDSAGNAYVTGWTSSADFPISNAFQSAYGGSDDAFVTKLNAEGSGLVYSTFLGGSARDWGQGIAVDFFDKAYVTGYTRSANFPTANAFHPANSGGTCSLGNLSVPCTDAFLTKLSAEGSGLIYSTYLGGTADDSGYGITVDSSGNAYVTGSTNSTNFPTSTNAIQALYKGFSPWPNAFVTKFNAVGSALVYSTYLGGSGGFGDYGRGITVDSSGNVYVAGWTGSANFPIAKAFQAALGGSDDAFVTKFNADGSALLYSTFLGGSGNDQGHGIAVDSSGSPYVTGSTSSTDFPIAIALQAASGGSDDVFVTKFNADGSALVYSTYLGGSGQDNGSGGISVDSAGNAYVTGFTLSSNFPTTTAFQATYAGNADAFVAKFSGFSAGPAVFDGGVVNGASFRLATEPGGAVAPGAIVSVFGTELATDFYSAAMLPLPIKLGDTIVNFNGVPAPLFAVSGGQINAQVPFNLQPGEVQVQVQHGSETSEVQPVTVAAVSPGIFTTNQKGTGQGAVLISNTPILAAPTGSILGRETRPANHLEFISIYCTGLGDVTNRPPSGEPPSGGPSTTMETPTVTIGGVEVSPAFSGLSGYVGLYQVDVQIPSDAPSGDSVPVIITIGGIPSNTVSIAIQ